MTNYNILKSITVIQKWVRLFLLRKYIDSTRLEYKSILKNKVNEKKKYNLNFIEKIDNLSKYDLEDLTNGHSVENKIKIWLWYGRPPLLERQAGEYLGSSFVV
tara:strand:- start:773 stop:1081 length:309 start_codon:yes stop_codon:yes gene_type:complete